jgi:hypothetical protein
MLFEENAEVPPNGAVFSQNPVVAEGREEEQAANSNEQIAGGRGRREDK